MYYNKTNSRTKSKICAGRCYLVLFCLSLSFISCKKYLDVVPDNIATIDNAFTSKAEAEKYLVTCYSYLPTNVDPTYNVGLSAGDEVWNEDPANHLRSTNVLMLPKGAQNVTDPIANFWDGTRDAVANYKAIRDCNIFLENVSNEGKVPDLDIDTRTRWIGEVEFLKAYYHFTLFRAYGPIPIIDKNLPISAPIEEARMKRQPVDSVVRYIAGLFEDAATKLPATITNEATELGRITKPAALGMEAKLLVTAASPLFNGNADYQFFTDKDGLHLFNPTFSEEKWQKAATACKNAIDICEANNIRLYTFPAQSTPLSDTTITQMSIRNAVGERWNSELVWGLTANNNINTNPFLQSMCAGQYDFNNVDPGKTANKPLMGPTLKMARMFYTKNGVPIDEDKTLNFSNIAELRTATHGERFDIKENETTARLNFDRENRFYADMGFDRSIWYMANSPSKSDENTWWLKSRAGEVSQSSPNPICGYYMKKLLNWHYEWSSVTFTAYPWPELRLADLYLLYAEALNESTGPGADVLEYVNKIRNRAGLPTVQTSWSGFSINPTKYQTKEGMRAIIQRERSIELCFEGQRFWDLVRWKTASQELNGVVTGWNVQGKTADTYYRETTIFARQFAAPRDYLWPLLEYDLLVNQNLVQNPNW